MFVPVRNFKGLLVDPEDKNLDCKFEEFFNNPDIDGWMVRQGLDQLHGKRL